MLRDTGKWKFQGSQVFCRVPQLGSIPVFACDVSAPVFEMLLMVSPSLRLVAGCTALLLLTCSPAYTAEAVQPGAPLRVGITEDPPFATLKDGVWRGLSADIWTAVASRSGTSIDWVPVAPGDAPALLRAGKIDIGPAQTITADRLRQVEFTPPVLASGVAIATIEAHGWDWQAILRSLWSSGVFLVVGAILVGNLVVGCLLWQIERRRNPAQFGGNAAQGFASGVWCSISTMTTVGYGDKVPTTWTGRIVCFMTMLSGVIVISLFTAATTSALTVAHLQPRVRNAADLKHVISVATTGSAGAAYLQRNGLPMVLAPDLDAALALLDRGDAAALMEDRVALRARLQRQVARRVTILPLILEENFYAFPITADRERQRQLVDRMQEFIDSTAWDRSAAGYLGE